MPRLFCRPTVLPPFFFPMGFRMHLLLSNWELNCRLSLLLHTAREKWIREQTYSPALGKCPEFSDFRKLSPKRSFHSHQNSSFLLAFPFCFSQAGTPGKVSYPVKQKILSSLFANEFVKGSLKQQPGRGSGSRAAFMATHTQPRYWFVPNWNKKEQRNQFHQKIWGDFQHISIIKK